MYLLKNAVKSITRNKLRNILIGIIVLIISVSACVALSIRQAADVAKQDAQSGLKVTAQISFDRQKAMDDMKSKMENFDPSSEKSDKSKGFDRKGFDFDVLQGSSLTLDEYLKYTKAQRDGDGYYYSGALSLNSADENLLPYGTEESDEDSSTSKKSDNSDKNTSDAEFGDKPQFDGSDSQGGQFMPGGPMGGERFQISRGDFSITGYSSYEAVASMFGSDGSYSFEKGNGKIYDESSSALECVISSELAGYNNLSVGDTLKLSNPNFEDEVYEIKIVGIYTNSESASQENNRFAMNDPANRIYMNYNALSAIMKKSADSNNTYTDSDGEEKSAVLEDTVAFTYTFSSVDNYNYFAEKVYDLGLSKDYTVSSNDASSYEDSMVPLNTLSKTALWFFFIVLAVGGIILITLNIFNFRERKYEVGVLTAIGMKKAKVAAQFVTEIFIVTFIALIIGTSIGAAVSVPVTNKLLQNQIKSSQTSDTKANENMGFDMKNAPKGGPMGGNMPDQPGERMKESKATEYVSSVSGATNIVVILELVLVGLFLTITASLAALISIMRYEPLKILSGRT